MGLFQKLADTPEDAELIAPASDGVVIIQATGWADGGQTLLYWEAGRVAPDIGVVSMAGDLATELLFETELVEAVPSVSPEGDWIAYDSNETGQSEVYVQRFPGLGDRQIISTDGGRQPLWSPDGRELFYRAPTGMIRVPVLATEPTFRAGDAEVLFESQYFVARSSRTYDIHPDGQRFLMVKDAELTDDSGASVQPQIVLIQNWHEELERLVPVP